ncbi:hypothetical protein NPIL_304164 [Nephila pilipes]|uniref:Uncharacterized protein n=1 Tax=Nephila pilipes TaxID=299642 RepID=A0A8X6QC95_NEPPI|nr:hypothetical protein NPIL_304164 [Nephila pilipes]
MAHFVGCPESAKGELFRTSLNRENKKDVCRRHIRSSWMSDPLSCGSYSYLSVDCEKENVTHLDLAEPEYADSPCSKAMVAKWLRHQTRSWRFSFSCGLESMP